MTTRLPGSGEVWVDDTGVPHEGWVDDADQSGYATLDGGQLDPTSEGYPYTDTTTGGEPARGTGLDPIESASEHVKIAQAQRVIGVEENGTDPLYRTKRSATTAPANVYDYNVNDQQDLTTQALGGLGIGQPPARVSTVGGDIYNATQYAVGSVPVRIAMDDPGRTKLYVSNTDPSAVGAAPVYNAPATTNFTTGGTQIAPAGITSITVYPGTGGATIQLFMNGRALGGASAGTQSLTFAAPTTSPITATASANQTGTVAYTSAVSGAGTVYLGNQSSVNVAGFGSISLPAGTTITRTHTAEVWAVCPTGPVQLNVEVERSRT